MLRLLNYFDLKLLGGKIRKADSFCISFPAGYILTTLVIKCVYHFLGLPGKRGEPGPRGVQGEKGNSGGVTGGAVYTRWGRSDCPKSSKTTMLYAGKWHAASSKLYISCICNL